MSPKNSIVIFDGECMLCNRAVNLILKNDKKGIFKFCTFKNALSKKLIPDSQASETIILIQDDKLFYCSAAVLNILRGMDGLWPLLQILYIIPRPCLNWLYNCVSNHRFHWFGKIDACQSLDINYKDRFL